MAKETPFILYWREVCPKLYLAEAWCCYKLAHGRN